MVGFGGLGNVERSYESELETNRILANIEEINNSLITNESKSEVSGTDIKNEARTAPATQNIFQKLWEQILGCC